MYLDRETYERAGLVGEPHGVKGKREGKPRWSKSNKPSHSLLYCYFSFSRSLRGKLLVVEYDLLSPSMIHGKKGFDRLLYACKNVFSEPISWLCTTSKSKGR